ncbi:MAG: hypothetical protein PHF63_08055 [Herbinix sp.]|nr:hypothetical protein [Herbinix sp.]
MKSKKCERCPDEDTNKCITCNPDKPTERIEITIEEAIEYFNEENERYESMLRNQVNLVMEYRINLLAIEALQEKLINEANQAAGL